jgi:ubiquinone/menaquinone biosynthesis C-methylase UbiE
MNTKHVYFLSGSVAEMYEQNMVPASFARFAKGILDFAQLRSGERVLDVACGTGIVARLASPLVAPAGRLVGLDFNAPMLDVACREAEKGGMSIEWHEADAASMPFADSTFDVVLCQLGLQYFTERHAAMREMHRVLCASGRLVLSVFRPVACNPSHAVFSDALERHVGAAAAATRRAPFALSDRDEIRALVAEAGFHDVAVHLDVRVARYPSAEGMVRIMMAGTPLAAAMGEADPSVLQTVITEVTTGLAEYEDDQGLALPMQMWVVTAKA